MNKKYRRRISEAWSKSLYQSREYAPIQDEIAVIGELYSLWGLLRAVEQSKENLSEEIKEALDLYYDTSDAYSGHAL